MKVNALLCRLPRFLGGGHKRGKQHGMQIVLPDGRFQQMYRCGRCGATWTRKLRAKPQP